MPAPALPVLVLNLHHDFACRHSGACCAAGWDIPVEPGIHEFLLEAMAAGRLRLPGGRDAGGSGDTARRPFLGGPGLPDGSAAIVAKTPAGDCVFFDRAQGRTCAIHAQLGEDRLPEACRVFPRVALTDDGGVRVTLSHFCPTAASMLFRRDVGRLDVVRDPPAYAGRALQGFDARGALPPLLRPGVLFDAAGRRAWDQFVLRTCDRDRWAPTQVLAALVRGAERLRSWTPVSGPLEAHAWALSGRLPFDRPESPAFGAARIAALYDLVAASVPRGLPRPAWPGSFGDTAVADAWRGCAALAAPVRRYVATRAFAAWASYQGEGLRTEVTVLAAALAVLCVEVVRVAGSAPRPLDAALLLSAIREADRLTVHLSSSDELVRSLASVEREPASVFLARFGMTGG